MKTTTIQARGMHCPSCERLIERSLQKTSGVSKVDADYPTEMVKVTFDAKKTSIKKIKKIIESKGYDCSEESTTVTSFESKLIGGLVVVIAILLVSYYIFELSESVVFPAISQDMGYGLLFLVGLLTGFHCISMCGGFVMSYTAKSAKAGKPVYKSHLMYGVGKTVSYTIIGAAFGLLGSIIAFTPMMRGVAGILAGLFLLLFGLKMLNVLPFLRNFRFNTPKFIQKFVGKESSKHNDPLIIGLLNGLMIACGPLQAIYIMAAGTGSVFEGAKLLFVFGLGTLPVMIGFGFFASFVSSKLTHKILKLSGALVMIFGLLMINNGLALTGTGFDATSLVVSTRGADSFAAPTPQVEGDYQIIRMDVNRYGWEPDRFILKAGVPVKWIITGKEINGCNNAIQVPKLNLEFDIVEGEQTIEFTPEEEGVVSWSCWMGMIPGVFVVKENIDLVNNTVTPEVVKEEIAKVAVPQAGSCGGSCGSSTCGGGTPSGCGCGG